MLEKCFYFVHYSQLEAMTTLSFSHEEQQEIFKSVAGVLHLGNVNFRFEAENKDNAVIHEVENSVV